MGKLNYSKWDNLELSDDSDIEVHPNVDKQSFIRWKQRDIHEKREMRKIQRSHYEAEHRTNAAVVPILETMIEQTSKEGTSYYSREVSRMKADREARGNKDGPEGPTLDDIMLSLLLQINEEPDIKKSHGTPQLDDALVTSMKAHIQKIGERQKTIEKELREMDEEDKKKITSDSLREGWNISVRYVTYDSTSTKRWKRSPRSPSAKCSTSRRSTQVPHRLRLQRRRAPLPTQSQTTKKRLRLRL